MSEELDFDPQALRSWLDTALGSSVRFDIAPIPGGGSCEMFDIRTDDQHLVMRKAPTTVVSDTAHDVVREYEVIRALQGEGVRVPRVHIACLDTGVVGAPFFLMDFIEGDVIRRKLPKRFVDVPESQSRIGEELIDALAELHAFEWIGTSLETLSSPDNYLARQITRWLSQYAQYACRDLPAIDSVADWLSRHRPAAGELTVMHGDYKIDNVLYGPGIPPRVASLVDFEMTTVGDPLIDLAWVMIFWPEEGNLIAIAGPNTSGGMHADYCQTPDTLVARYVERTGRTIHDFQWYQAFAAWKLAILLEGSYSKFLAGTSRNRNHEMFGFVADQLLLRAARFAT